MHHVPLLGDAEVDAHLDLPSAIERLTSSFVLKATGGADSLQRIRFGPAPGIAVMGGFDRRWAVVKMFMPGSPSAPSAAVYDLERKRLVAHVVSGRLSALRTAAVSAVATRQLAPPGAGSLAIIGAGRQARGHAEVLVELFGFGRLMIFSRTASRARELAAKLRDRYELEAVVVETLEEATQDADVICLATSSETPFLHARHVKAGSLILAVGANRRGRREVATDVVASARVVVDDLDQARVEADELRVPIQEGTFHWSAVSTLGDVLQRPLSERTSPENVAVFKNLGSGLADVAIMGLLVERSGVLDAS